MGRAESRVYLERPSARRAAEFLSCVRMSQSLHRPWVKAPHTRDAYLAFLRRSRLERQASYFVCSSETRELVGVINLNEIVRGLFQSAYAGYYAFAPHAGAGNMAEGLALVLNEAFGPLGLHRVEANVQPKNESSRRLVSGLGFRLEGLSPRYLKIGGRWRDHERWAMLAEDWKKRRKSRFAR